MNFVYPEHLDFCNCYQIFMYSSWCPEMFKIVRRKIFPLTWSEQPLCSVPSVKLLPWLPEGFSSLVVSQDRLRKCIKEKTHRLFSNETIGFMYYNLTEKVLLGCFIYAHYIYICIKRYGRNFCFWLTFTDTVWSAFLQPFSQLRDLADLQLSTPQWTAAE